MIRRNDNEYIIDFQARNGEMFYYHWRTGQESDIFRRIQKHWRMGLLLPSDVAQLNYAVQDAATMDQLPPLKPKGVIEKFMELIGCFGK